MAKDAPKDVPRELERAGALCLAFANTAAPGRDDRRRDPRVAIAVRLESYAELGTWAQRMGILGAAEGERLRRAASERPEDAAAVVARAVELRASLMRIFTALAGSKEPRAEDLDTVNGALRARWIVPGPSGFRRDWVGDAQALDRVLWPVAHSAVELLSCEQHRKVRQCATKGCFRLFVYGDRRRRWCDVNICGSRARGRRHHEHLRRLSEKLESLTPAERRKRMEQLDEVVRQRQERKSKAVAELRRWQAERAAGSKQAEEPGAERSDPAPPKR